jgi:hypothetical protein
MFGGFVLSAPLSIRGNPIVATDNAAALRNSRRVCLIFTVCLLSAMLILVTRS